jgi:pyruvate dehydrogenase E2 component (dihydrolipoamide acetyltransferase)
MGHEFKFPDLGEGITEGELVRWLVHVGDEVQEDQEVAEVETDKALVTIPSPISGKIEKLCFQEGDKIPVGEVLMIFAEEAGPSEAKSEEAATEIKTKPKAQPEAAAPAKEKTGAEKKAVPAISIPLSETPKGSLPPLATPHTRKLARDMGVDLNKVKGSGPHGRITDEDVKAFAEGGAAPTAPTPLPVTPSEAGPAPAGENFEKYGPVERTPLKGVRRKISENMLIAHQQTVMVTHMDEAEVGELLKIRKEKAEFAKRKGVKLTLLPFLMKACTIALKDYPSLNASLAGEEIVYKKYYHFGFAVDTDAGLMVPVIRDVDKKSILHLASELLELSHKARERKIALEDFQGHSFSITNIGSIGGKNFTPIINYPDAAILGLGRTHEKPMIRDGEVVAASVLPLCLTFDHRVTDGATAARFVNQVITYLKDPDLLLLEDGED